MAKARRAYIKAKYRNYDVSDKINSFTYTDSLSLTDDISISFDDREEDWLNNCFPQFGDKIEVWIGVRDWLKEGDDRTIALGEFDVDSVSSAQLVKITGVSIPIAYGSRKEKKYKTYENMLLSAICKDIADICGLSLFYDVDYDPLYDKIEQSDETDIEFLEKICDDEGLCLKMTNGQLVIFDEYKYDQQTPIKTIRRNFASTEREDNDIIGFPTLKRNVSGLYEACEITYYDSSTDETETGYFKDPNAPESLTAVLRIRESMSTKKESVDLNRKARTKLREQNKAEWTISIKVVGDIIYCTGTTIMIEGYGNFDGKYFVNEVKHSISTNGYTCTLDLRRCLDY